MLGTLRQRLLALFLLVSIIPSLGLTLFVTFYLSRSIAALRNPEPEQESLLAAREQGGLITGGEAPRQVSGVAPMGKGYMLLAGYQLDPEISKEILSLQKNLVMYRKLGVYTWISERSLWIFAGIWTLVLGLLSFGLAYLVSRGIARPVLELRGGMERVSGGDLSHRVTPSGTQEARFLGKTFNEMVEELQTSR